MHLIDVCILNQSKGIKVASLSSKRKTFANRRLQERDRRADKAPKAAALTARQMTALVFDELIYTSAKSRYQTAIDNAAAPDADIAIVMRVLIQEEFDIGGREAALRMQPYIVKYVTEYRDAKMEAQPAVFA